MEFIRETNKNGIEGAIFRDKDGEEFFIETSPGERGERKKTIFPTYYDGKRFNIVNPGFDLETNNVFCPDVKGCSHDNLLCLSDEYDKCVFYGFRLEDKLNGKNK